MKLKFFHPNLPTGENTTSRADNSISARIVLYSRILLTRLTDLMNSRPVIIILIVLGVMLLSTSYGALINTLLERKVTMMVAALPLLVIGALVVLRWPPLGLVAIIAADLVIPFSLGTGSQTTLGAPLLLLIACLGLWVLEGLVEKKTMRFFRSKPVLPLACFLVVCMLASINGQLPWFSTVGHAPIRAQLGGLALFFMAAFAFMIVASQITKVVWLETMVWVFLGLSSIYIAGRFIPPLGSIAGKLFSIGVMGSVFWVWLAALSASQALVNKHLKPRWRLGLGLLAVLTIAAGLKNASWTSGWLPPVLAVGVVILLGLPRFGLVMTGLIGAGSLLAYNRASQILMQGDNEYSLLTRMDAWEILYKVAKISPVLGLGPANYYWYTPLFPIRGYAVSFNSHNNYVDFLAEIGIIGLACFFWFAGTLAWLGWNLRSRVPEGFQKAYVIGALGGLVGTLASGMLGDWIIPFVYNVGYTGFRASLIGWLFMGGLAALDLLNPRPETAQHV